MTSARGNDPYTILGVDRDADAATIKRAWRALAKTLHPDVTGGLSDDAFAHAHAAYQLALTMATISPPVLKQPQCTCVNVNVSSSMLSALPPHNAWEHVTGRWQEGSDIHVSVHIDHQSAGGTVVIPLDTSTTCSTCGGDGVHVDYGTPCVSCDGKGRHNRALTSCSVCNGTGLATSACPACSGTGQYRRTRSYRVIVPADAADGHTSILSRSGNPGVGGAPPGHLHLTWHLPAN